MQTALQKRKTAVRSDWCRHVRADRAHKAKFPPGRARMYRGKSGNCCSGVGMIPDFRKKTTCYTHLQRQSASIAPTMCAVTARKDAKVAIRILPVVIVLTCSSCRNPFVRGKCTQKARNRASPWHIISLLRR